jgi:hypothetical protein
MGSIVCFCLALQLVQIQERVKKLFRTLHAVKPAEPLTVWGHVREMFVRGFVDAPDRGLIPGTPIPLRYYLWFVVPTMFGCVIIAGFWFWPRKPLESVDTSVQRQFSPAEAKLVAGESNPLSKSAWPLTP